MSRRKELADAIKRKIKPGEPYIRVGRIMAREIIKELEGKGCDRSDTPHGKAGKRTADPC